MESTPLVAPPTAADRTYTYLAIGVCAALLFALYLWMSKDTSDPSPATEQQRYSLNQTLATVQKIAGTESYASTEEELFLSPEVQALVASAQAPLNNLYPTEEQQLCFPAASVNTIPKFIENVKSVMVQGFRSRLEGLDNEPQTAFEAINSGSFRMDFTNLGVLCIQLELMNSGRSSAIRISRDASNKITYVKLDETTQNFLMLGLFNVLVDEANLGASGMYMTMFINANIGKLDAHYFGGTTYTFRDIAATIRDQMAGNVSGSDWISNDEKIAEAIQKASLRPVPIDLIAIVLIISMYNTSKTFKCSAAV